MTFRPVKLLRIVHVAPYETQVPNGFSKKKLKTTTETNYNTSILFLSNTRGCLAGYTKEKDDSYSFDLPVFRAPLRIGFLIAMIYRRLLN